jgi:hypothetical protein
MTVDRSGWAFWIGAIYLLMCVLALGYEAYVEFGNSGLRSPFTGELRTVMNVSTVAYVFFALALMRQRKSVYFWTVVTTLVSIVAYAMLINRDPSSQSYTAAAIGGFVQLLLLALVLRLMATDRLE